MTHPRFISPPKGFWPRPSAVDRMLYLMEQKKLHLISEPPSCGKSALLNAALSCPDVLPMKINLRSFSLESKESAMAGFQHAFQSTALHLRSKAKLVGEDLAKVSLLPAVKALTGIAGAFIGIRPSVADELVDRLESVLLKETSKLEPVDIIGILDKTVDIVHRSDVKRHLVIVVDEVNLLDPQDASCPWKKDLICNLLEFFTKVTKESGKASVLLATSTQRPYQSYPGLLEKCFVRLHHLNYMGFDETDAFLNDFLAVDDQTARKKIYDTVGGHFTLLEDAAAAFHEGFLDIHLSMIVAQQKGAMFARMARCSPEARLAFQRNLMPYLAKTEALNGEAAEASKPGSKGRKRGREDESEATIGADIGTAKATGKISLDVAAAAVPQKLLDELIHEKLLSVAYPTHPHWAGEFSQDETHTTWLTPFVPLDRSWMNSTTANAKVV